MMDQRTDEWYTARLGKATASRMGDIMAKTKTGYGASRENYKFELALERITQRKAPGFTSAAMQWGIDTEPAARSAYEIATGGFVTEVGLIDHPTIRMAGASPDGLVGDDGVLEIKCPESKKHFETLVTKKPSTDYVLQMQWQMACTGRQWCDFVSFDPRFPEHLQVFMVRINRDSELIAQMEAEVTKFLSEVDELVERINK